jgi:adenylate cyclase
MGVEIERKFLVKNDSWRDNIQAKQSISQGYLSVHPDRTVRVRISNTQAFLTIKSKSIGSVREEYEYEIPLSDGKELLALCEKPILSKTRFIIEHHNHKWEIDEFELENKGLIVAEVELKDENEHVEFPGWVGKEVTQENKYFNSQLGKNPFSNWH